MRKNTSHLKYGGKRVKGMYIILVYDIDGDEKGTSVLRKMFKTCKKYLTHIQKSVFEGELSEAQLTKLRMEVNKIIRKELDSVIIFKASSDKWLNKEMWGLVDDKLDNFL